MFLSFGMCSSIFCHWIVIFSHNGRFGPSASILIYLFFFLSVFKYIILLISEGIGFFWLFHMADLGLRQPRLEGEEYLSIVDEFMEAVHARWPKAIVQVGLLNFFSIPHWYVFVCIYSSTYSFINFVIRFVLIMSVWGLPNEVGFWNPGKISEKVLHV